ncbi:ArsR/SmtB family transcription factor [Methanolacinia paynteri]|uniref:ArsR/SmtB family transcription factor n=1 Tax=Methanolacinia paynteri TaxID=230356 RepID=UPI0006939A90|nr:winged helix-turn-helix domain-containing protein [Methanolacinia paynteri]
MAVDKSEVILDKEIFEVLSSDKRIDILKSLNTRRKTNSELAREFSLQESTMHHHLMKLEEAGLIQPVDSKNKWIYYELTAKGDAILNPDKDTRFTILISSLLTYIAAFAAFYTYISIPKLSSKPFDQGILESLTRHLATSPFLSLFVICLIIAIAQTIVLVFYFLKKKNYI